MIGNQEIDNLTLNEIKFYYEVICRALQLTCEVLAGGTHTGEVSDEKMEEIMGEYLQRSQEQIGLEFSDFEGMSLH